MAQPGQQVFNDRYELHRKIARGGMATVFLARDLLLDRPVALKVLAPELANDPAFVQRFRREAQAAANLAHANIVSVYDWGQEGGTYFIVMEYVDGASLAQILSDEGTLAPGRAAQITGEIAVALGFAHRNGVIHRDVKPGNVIISPTGQVKVTDFGIARAVTTQENLTQTGTVMGTATYFSPEQAKGEPVDRRSDVYSLGVVLYEMLSGRPPFVGDNPVSVAYKHVQETPEWPRARNPAVPPALEAVVLKAMAKNPANRYASAEELGADLNRFREGRTVSAEPLLAPPAAGEATRAVANRTDAGATVATAGGGGTRTLRRVDDEAAVPAGDRPGPDDGPPSRRNGTFVGVMVLLLLAGLLFLFARNLGVGAAEVEVPSVLRLSEDDAIRRLEDLGLEVDVEAVEDARVDQGQVVAQDPEAGTTVDEGDTVTISVSSGAPQVEVPDVTGQSEADARAELEEQGLGADVRTAASDDVEAGTVVSQDPGPGTRLAEGGTVMLTISSGPEAEAVPNVVGRRSDEAAAVLAGAGFDVSFEDVASDDVDEGFVVRTDPPAGSEVGPGSRVVVVVSSGPPPTTTTSSTSTPSTTTSTSTPPTTGGGGGGGGG